MSRPSTIKRPAGQLVPPHEAAAERRLPARRTHSRGRASRRAKPSEGLVDGLTRATRDGSRRRGGIDGEVIRPTPSAVKTAARRSRSEIRVDRRFAPGELSGTGKKHGRWGPGAHAPRAAAAGTGREDGGQAARTSSPEEAREARVGPGIAVSRRGWAVDARGSSPATPRC